MNYLSQINFNKECIALYMKENIDKMYNTKIYTLLRENIEYYRILNIQKRKVITEKTTYITKTTKPVFAIRDSEYKKREIEDIYGSYDNYLIFDKV